MFEEKTFENILSIMLSHVAEKDRELDVREGSVIYTALAPIALELESVYHELDMVLEETFLETASKEYLVKHGNQIGMTINEATFGHFVGEFNVDVEIGSRFNLDKFNYNVIDKISNPTDDNQYYRFELVCETDGSEPNGYLGTLTPINYVSGLFHAELTSVILYGEDEEDTEAYRYRLQLHVKSPPSNGNIFQYNEWLDECLAEHILQDIRDGLYTPSDPEDEEVDYDNGYDYDLDKYYEWVKEHDHEFVAERVGLDLYACREDEVNYSINLEK
jgi:uncharacterized phage protein gp47/JayE